MAIFEKSPSAPSGDVVVSVAGLTYVIRDGETTEVTNRNAINALLQITDVRIVGSDTDWEQVFTPQPIYVAGDPDAGDVPTYNGSAWEFRVISGGGGAVASVNSRTGTVVLTAADVRAREDTWVPAASDISDAGAAGELVLQQTTAANIRTVLSAVNDSDSRLSDARTPTAGSVVNASVSASAAIALSKLATDPVARANHTGTQTASTISNFDTQVRTSRLDQMAAPTAAVSMNSQRLSSVANPTSSSDAATASTAAGVVNHAATAATARPSGYSIVIWIGSVEPTNRLTNDVWIRTA